MSQPISIDMWYQALGSMFGVIIQCSDPDKAKQKLYALRAQSADPDLEPLSIVTSPTNPDHDLWIVKRLSDVTPHVET